MPDYNTDLQNKNVRLESILTNINNLPKAVDLSKDTVTSPEMFKDITAHDKGGQQIVGSFTIQQELNNQTTLIQQIKENLATKVTPTPQPTKKEVVGSGTVTTNGIKTFSPKTGETYSSFTVTANCPEPKPEQEKSITLTEDGQTAVTPDIGKVLNKVTVNVDVIGKEPDEHTLLLLHGDSIQDSSIYNVPLTNNGVIVSTAQSKFGGKSFYFDGKSKITFLSKYVDFSDKDFTVDWWEKAEPDAQCRFATILKPLSGFMLGNAGNLILATSDGTSWDILNSSAGLEVIVGQWVHWAFVRNKTNAYLFKNGHIVQTLNMAGKIQASGNNNAAIGANAGDNQFWKGYIDEFRISDTARWTSDFTPPNKPYDNIISRNVQPLTIVQSGIYTAPKNIIGYNPVYVNIKERTNDIFLCGSANNFQKVRDALGYTEFQFSIPPYISKYYGTDVTKPICAYALKTVASSTENDDLYAYMSIVTFNYKGEVIKIYNATRGNPNISNVQAFLPQGNIYKYRLYVSGYTFYYYFRMCDFNGNVTIDTLNNDGEIAVD